jgi:hypothetical protein
MTKLEIGLAIAVLAGMSFISPKVRIVAGEAAEGLKTFAKRLVCLPIVNMLSWCVSSYDSSERLVRRKLLYVWVGIHSVLFLLLLFSPRNTLTLSVTVALLSLHFCIIAIALFVIKEETEWWDGLLSPEERVFENTEFIKDPAILLISTVFSLLFICLSVLTWDAVEKPLIIVLRAPKFHCGPAECQYVFYVVSLVRELPSVSAFIQKIAQILSYAEAIGHYLPGVEVLKEQTWIGSAILFLVQRVGQYLSYSIAVGHQLPVIGFLVGKIWTSEIRFSEWPGLPIGWAIYTVTWLWIFGVYTVLWRQRREIKQLLIAFQKTEDEETRRLLEGRAARAPAGIRTALLSMALDNHQAPLIQRSAIEIVPKAKIYTFPQKFVRSIRSQSQQIRHFGLEKIIAFLLRPGATFAPAGISSTLDTLVVTGRRRLDPETLKLMDVLVMEYTRLALHENGRALSNGKLRNRILRIAASSKEPELRQRALTMLAENEPVGLCSSVFEAVDKGEIGDTKRSNELLGTCAELIEKQRGEWAEADLIELSDLVSSVRRRRRSGQKIPRSTQKKLAEIKRLISVQPGRGNGATTRTSGQLIKGAGAPATSMPRDVERSASTAGAFSHERSPNELSNFNAETPGEEIPTSREPLGSARRRLNTRLGWAAVALIFLAATAAASYAFIPQWRGQIPSLTPTNIPGSTIPDSPTTNPPPQVQPSPEQLPPQNHSLQDQPRPVPEAPTGTIHQLMFSPASLICGKDAPVSWKFGDVRMIDLRWGNAPIEVTSCHLASIRCDHQIVVGVGTASSKGTDASEKDRALQRGINLALTLKTEFRERCKPAISVSSYVLNFGRYNDNEERDDPGQREVIALTGIGSRPSDEVVFAALQAHVKTIPGVPHYAVCDLYKLDDAGQPTLIESQTKICVDRSSTAVSQQ